MRAEALVDGASRAATDLVPVVQASIARLESPEPAMPFASPEEAAVTAVLLGVNAERGRQGVLGKAFVEFCVSTHGVTFAVQALAASRWLQTCLYFGDWSGAYVIERCEAVDSILAPASQQPWLHLRAHTTQADPETYHAALEVAARERERSPLSLRCLIDTAFPDEVWAASDAEEVLRVVQVYSNVHFSHGLAGALVTCALPLSTILRTSTRSPWGNGRNGCPTTRSSNPSPRSGAHATSWPSPTGAPSRSPSPTGARRAISGSGP